MSASAIIQAAVAAHLGRSTSMLVGDGAATEFVLEHPLKLRTGPRVKVELAADDTLLTEGEDYTVEATSLEHITVTATGPSPLLGAWRVTIACLSVPSLVSPAANVDTQGKVPILERMPRELESDIASAAAAFGMFLWVMPALPKKAQAGSPTIFFEEVEVRVRVGENFALSNFGINAYELAEEVAAALHWQPAPEDLGTGGFALLAHPLYLAPRCTEDADDEQTRFIDVIFHTAYGLRPVPGGS